MTGNAMYKAKYFQGVLKTVKRLKEIAISRVTKDLSQFLKAT
jgi:hypothetical protein